jgi:hypothetical protein
MAFKASGLAFHRIFVFLAAVSLCSAFNIKQVNRLARVHMSLALTFVTPSPLPLPPSPPTSSALPPHLFFTAGMYMVMTAQYGDGGSRAAFDNFKTTLTTMLLLPLAQTPHAAPATIATTLPPRPPRKDSNFRPISARLYSSAA